MLSSVARATPRPGALHSRHVAQTRRPTSLASTFLCMKCHQQREFRLSPWGWGSEHHRETRKPHRLLRYRYMESLKRNGWDPQAHADNAKADMIKTVSDFFDPLRASRCSRKHSDTKKTNDWPDDYSGTRPGRNIEDVEREAINQLFQPPSLSGLGAALWRSPFDSIRTFLHKQGQPEDPPTNREGIIDPITNRRVPTKVSPDETKTPKNNISTQKTSSFTPKPNNIDAVNSGSSSKALPAVDDMSPQDLHKYGPVRWNEPDGLRQPTAEENNEKYDDLNGYRAKADNNELPSKPGSEDQPKKHTNSGSYTSFKWNEPDGLQKPTAEEMSKKYEDLNRYSTSWFNDIKSVRESTRQDKSEHDRASREYNAVRWNEPDGLQKLTAEGLSKEYDDLHSYRAVKWNEPDGLQKQKAEELSKNYDDLGSYSSAKWNEPHGLPNKTSEELSKNYNDLDQYKSVRWNEPDGLRKLTPEEISKAYEDLHTYGSQFAEAKKAVLDEFEARSMDNTPRHEPFPEKAKCKDEGVNKEYKDLDAYGPVRWNEPDGLPKMSPEEVSKSYQDLHPYDKAVKSNEPDGFSLEGPEKASKPHGTHPYASRDRPEIEVVRRHPEEATKDYTDLDDYGGPVRWNEPDGLRKLTPEEKSKVYSDVGKYTSQENGFEDASATIHPEEASKKYQDLNVYAQYHGTSISKDQAQTEELYRSNRSGNLPHNLPSYPPRSRPGLHTYDAQKTKRSSTGEEESLDLLSAAEIRANMLRKAEQKCVQEKNQSGNHAELTGNYVRDFPEEFARSWSTENSATKASLLAEDQADNASNSVAQAKVSKPTMDESFSTGVARLESALDRNAQRRTLNSPNFQALPTERDTKDYGALETSQAESAPEPDLGVLPQPESTITTQPQSVSNSEISQQPESVPHTEPTYYKVLAYDASTDSIRIAEMSSAKKDVSILSPAEVLPLLSNPARFLPYFASLHAQGYEIASGRVNTLVFRKVRPAAENADSVPIDPEPERKPRQKSAPIVNPIDMMGKPVTGNFASPTGFVNYGTSSPGMVMPIPPYSSSDSWNTDPTSEKEEESQGRKKRSTGRKAAIGAAWAAGAAYAIGMAGEHAGKGRVKISAKEQE